MRRFIAISVRVSILLFLLLAGQYFPANARYTASIADSGPTNTGKVSQTISGKNSLTLAGATQIFLPLVANNYYAPAPLWRFGAGLTRNPLSAYNSVGLNNMRFGWYLDFSVNLNPTTPSGMEYVPVVRLKQLKLAADGVTKVKCCVGCGYVTPPEYSVSPSISTIQTMASNRPGMTWLIGNEMDRVDSGTVECGRQDEMMPELYAQAYHDIYTAIKNSDPTAQVAVGALVEFTPLRSQYLDRVWAEYSRLYGQTMPVDVWNTHLYVLQEVKDSWGADIPPGFSQTSGELYTINDNINFSLAWDQILALRTWMKNHDLQNKPLIISEYGVLWPVWLYCNTYPDTTGCPFTPEMVRDNFMYPSFDAFLNQTDVNLGYSADGNRLVQRWNWYSIDYDFVRCDAGVPYEYFGGSLFNSGLNLACSPTDFPPPRSLTALGTYWKQYVQNLPAGSTKPYTP